MQSISAIDDWRRGTISLCWRIGGIKLFDMDSRKHLDEDLEDNDESIYVDSSIMIEEDSDSSTSDDEDVNCGIPFG